MAWAVLQPVTSMVIFALLFGLLGRKPVQPGTSYAVSAFCGLLPWQFFAGAVTAASGSLVNNRNMITKVYFPRTALPFSSVLGASVDFAIAFAVLILLMAWFRVVPSAAVIALPLFLLLALLTASGAGLLLSALNALYRDVGYVIPFLLQLGFLASPVVYETQVLIPARWRLVYAINPLVGIIDGFRWTLLAGPAPQPLALGISVAAGVTLFATGLIVFGRSERVLTDRI